MKSTVVRITDNRNLNDYASYLQHRIDVLEKELKKAQEERDEAEMALAAETWKKYGVQQ